MAVPCHIIHDNTGLEFYEVIWPYQTISYHTAQLQHEPIQLSTADRKNKQWESLLRFCIVWPRI